MVTELGPELVGLRKEGERRARLISQLQAHHPHCMEAALLHISDWLESISEDGGMADRFGGTKSKSWLGHVEVEEPVGHP